ncbi:MAG: calcium/sodium antiporter [Planctomycetia bacterium]|nr:calcium/sodium antiporter [Planctomycetia bacterium]
MLEEYLQNPWLASLAVVLGGGALIAGGEALVRGASKIALGLKISPLIVGLTIVALCTSAPEMAVSLSAALGSDPSGADVALGNVVGSNVCNVLLILGICALVKPLSTSTTLVKRDFPLAAFFSLATLAAVFVARQDDGSFHLPQIYGFLLLAAFVVYEIVAIRQARRDPDAQNADVAEQSQEKKNAKYWLVALCQLVFGLAFLVAGAQGFVGGAVSIARMIGVSELVIGLTLVAIGTSLPELTVSVIATLRGEVDVAMGNVVGSNLCNLLLILGGTLSLLPQGIAVQRQSAFVDLPVMAASAILVAWFAFTGRKVERWEGACLLAGQIGYAVYLVA